MAQKPGAMEQLKQVRKLQEDGIPNREIARRVGISRNSVRKYLSRFIVENPRKLTPSLRSKLTPFRQSKLTPSGQMKLTP